MLTPTKSAKRSYAALCRTAPPAVPVAVLQPSPDAVKRQQLGQQAEKDALIEKLQQELKGLKEAQQQAQAAAALVAAQQQRAQVAAGLLAANHVGREGLQRLMQKGTLTAYGFTASGFK